MTSPSRSARTCKHLDNPVLPHAPKKRVVIEAASPFGRKRYAGEEGLVIGMNRFGASAPYKALAE